MIRVSKEEKDFVRCAEDEHQLGEEAAFIIANAQFGSFFGGYSENLLDALNYPHDDVEAALRLFYYCKKVGFGTTEVFSKKYSVDWPKFGFVRDLAARITPAKLRDPTSCKPCDECACIDLIRMMFSRRFIANSCIFAGGSTFLDCDKALLIKISPESAVHCHSKMWDCHPAVYFRLKQYKGVQFANFLCLVPPMVKAELMFSEITDSKIQIGESVAEKIIQSASEAENTLGRFAVFCGYDKVSGKLSVKHAKHILGQLKEYIGKQMESVLEETTRLNRRHFWIEERKTLVVLGAGLQVQDLVVGENATHALLIDLERQLLLKEIHQWKAYLKDAFSSASCRVLTIGKRSYLLMILPSVRLAQQLLKDLLTAGRQAKYYRFDYGSDLWDYTKGAVYSERCAVDLCGVCLVPPEEKKFIRLGLCGHILCDECAMHCLRSVESFPIKCAIKECPGTLLVDDIDVLLSHFGPTAKEDTESSFLILVKHALTHFLQTNEVGYRRCLNNNCPGILDPKYPVNAKVFTGIPAKKEALMNGVICCICQKIRCGMCGLDVHPAVGCQQYFQSMYEAQNPGINEWKSTDPKNRRFCPNNTCHAIIEKAAGCNHMQCLRCRKHFCWICDDFQSTASREIYAHLEEVHRGNGAEGLEVWEDYLE